MANCLTRRMHKGWTRRWTRANAHRGSNARTRAEDFDASEGRHRARHADCAYRLPERLKGRSKPVMGRVEETLPLTRGGRRRCRKARTPPGEPPRRQRRQQSLVCGESEKEQRGRESRSLCVSREPAGELTVNDMAGSLVAAGKPGQGYPAVAFAIQSERVRNPPAGPDGVGALDTMKVHYTLPKSGHRVLRRRQRSRHLATPPSPRPPRTHGGVRRLTPEKPDPPGFPVGYTLIPRTSSKKRKGEDLSATIDYLMSLGLPAATRRRSAGALSDGSALQGTGEFVGRARGAVDCPTH